MSYRTPGYGFSTGGGGGLRTFLVGAAAGAIIGGGVVYTLMQRSVEDAKRAGGGRIPTVGAERGDIGTAVSSEDITTTSTGNTVDDATHPALRLGWPVGTESLLRVHRGSTRRQWFQAHNRIRDGVEGTDCHLSAIGFKTQPQLRRRRLR